MHKDANKQARARASEGRRKAAGGRMVRAMLTKEEAEALATMTRLGFSVRDVIGGAIMGMVASEDPK